MIELNNGVYDAGEPEGALANLVRALADGNWSWAANLTQLYWIYGPKGKPSEGRARLRRLLGPLADHIKAEIEAYGGMYEVVGWWTMVKGPCMTEAHVRVRFPSGVERVFHANVVRELVPKCRRKWLFWWQCFPRPSEEGAWGVNPVSLLKGLG